MNRNDRLWAMTLALIAVHQTEEVMVSVEDWYHRVGTTTMPWLDRHLEGNWMAAHEPRRRVAAQTVQCAGLATVWALTRRNARATQVATSALCAGWSAAFAMHLTASWRTRSATKLVRAAREHRDQEMLADIRSLGIEVTPLPHDAGIRLARLRAHSRAKMPDCCVLLTAEQTSARVATFDEDLKAAAGALGLEVL